MFDKADPYNKILTTTENKRVSTTLTPIRARELETETRTTKSTIIRRIEDHERNGRIGTNKSMNREILNGENTNKARGKKQ